MTRALGLTTIIALVLAAAPAAAQSLGDVAKKEEARRKTGAKSGKTYTNENLRGDLAPPPAAPAAPGAAAPGAAPKPPDASKPDDRKKDEAQWRARIAEARQGLDRAKMFQEALQTRINSLSSDFASRDDPAQRSVVASNRQKALAELDRVTKEIADFEKQIETIQEEGRKAGIPPGWLR
jgi:hypothetical protein